MDGPTPTLAKNARVGQPWRCFGLRGWATPKTEELKLPSPYDDRHSARMARRGERQKVGTGDVLGV
jgi:hypothetical protein